LIFYYHIKFLPGDGGRSTVAKRVKVIEGSLIFLV